MGSDEMLLTQSWLLIRLLLDGIIAEGNWQECAKFERVANLQKSTGKRYLSRLSITIDGKLEARLKKRIELYHLDALRTKFEIGGCITIRIGIKDKEEIPLKQPQTAILEN